MLISRFLGITKIDEYSDEEQYIIARNIVYSGNFKEYDINYVDDNILSDALKTLKKELSNNNTNVKLYVFNNDRARFDFGMDDKIHLIMEYRMEEPTEHYKVAQQYDDYAIRNNKKTSIDSIYVVDIMCSYNGIYVEEAYEDFKYRYSTKIPNDFVHSYVDLNWSGLNNLTPDMKSIIQIIKNIEDEYNEKLNNCFDSSDLDDVIDWIYVNKLDVDKYV